MIRKIVIICILVNTLLYAKNISSPIGWPWKGVDTMAYVVDSDPKALQFIIDNNIKYVRIHFFKKKVMRDYNVSGDEALELNLKWAKKINDKLNLHGIQSFITLADFPISLKECINKKKASYWGNKSCIDQIYHDVNKTVTFFKDSNILGYEFLGEPVVVKNNKSIEPKKWNQIFKNIITITRKTDQDKWLFYSPGPWGLPARYDEVVPFKDTKIVYNAHMYTPHRFTHQNIGKNKNNYSYPGWIRFKYWDKVALKQSLIPLINFQRKYDKPVSISEFSAVPWAEGNEQYITDLIEIFNEQKWSWMYFNIGSVYKGWDARFDSMLDKNKKRIFYYKGSYSTRFKVLQPFLEMDKNTTKLDIVHNVIKENNETVNNRK